MWRSLNIAKKIYFSIALIIAGYSLSMVYVFIDGHAARERLDRVSIILFPASLQSRTASNAFKEQLKAYEDAVTIGEPKLLSLSLEKRDTCIAALREISANTSLPEDDRKHIQEDISRLQNFSEQAQTTYAVMATGKTVPQEKATELLTQARELETRLKALSSYFSQQLQDEITSTNTSAKRGQVINGFVFFLVVIPSLILLTFVLTSIIRRLNATVSRLRYISNGVESLDARIDAAKGKTAIDLLPASEPDGDEITLLANSFDLMANVLQKSFRKQEELLQAVQQRNESLSASEERFSQLFRQNDDAILLIDPKTLQVVDANPAALVLYGISYEELPKLSPIAFIDRHDLRKYLEPITQEELMLHNVTSFRPDGGKIIISLKAKMIRMKDGQVLYCSIRDMTEKVRLEEEIKTSQAKLIQANKMTSLGMLVSGVAHEINNPNQCIAVNTSVLRNIWHDASPIVQQYCEESGKVSLGGLPCRELEEMVPQLFSGIADSSQRINAIVANMRDYVVSGPGRKVEGFDVNAVIMNATAILWHNINKYTDYFRKELADGIPPAYGDPQQVEQVIINLIMNSLQALPDKSHEVSVATAFDAAAGKVVITVKDDGKGMDVATMQRLTEPFFTTREQEGGTGLGLYISTTIIKEYQGSLEFDSEPGKGTTATIRLPLANNCQG